MLKAGARAIEDDENMQLLFEVLAQEGIECQKRESRLSAAFERLTVADVPGKLQHLKRDMEILKTDSQRELSELLRQLKSLKKGVDRSMPALVAAASPRRRSNERPCKVCATGTSARQQSLADEERHQRSLKEIETLRHENESLRKMNADFEEKYTDLRIQTDNEIKLCQESIADADHLVSGKNSEIQKLSEDLRMLRADFTGVKALHDEVIREKMASEGNHAELEKILEERANENKRLLEKIRTLEPHTTEVEDLRKKLCLANDRDAKSNEHAKEMNEKLQLAAKRCSHFESAAKALAKEDSDLRSENENLRNGYAALQSEHKELLSENNVLTESSDSQRKEIDRSKAILNASARKYEEELAAQSQNTFQMQLQMSELEKVVETQKTDLKGKSDALASIEADLRSNVAKVTSLEAELAKVAEEKKSVEADLKAKSDAVNSVQAEHRSAVSTITSVQAELAKAMEEKKSEAEADVEKRKKLKSELQRIRAERDGLKTQLAEVEKAASAAKKKSPPAAGMDVTAEVKTLKSQLEHTDQMLEVETNYNTQMKKTIAHNRIRIKELEAKIDKTDQDKQATRKTYDAKVLALEEHVAKLEELLLEND